jgi:hypothetical protein
MKHLVCGLTFAAIALAQHPVVSECFKVRELLRADEEHYWATWSNTCPYTIDAVYVTVRFADRSSKDLADGVWSLHFIPPGAHRTMRFSAPGKIADFASVHQKKITSDMAEAFGREMQPAKPLSAIELAAVAAYRTAVAKDSDMRPRETHRETMISAVVGDPGEGSYQAEVVAAPVISVGLLVGTAAQAAPGEPSFRTDFPDPWQSLLSPQESAVSIAPRGSFVRFVSEEKPIYQ